MARRLVALLAQERRALLQEIGNCGAVRVVADSTVFLHRLVRAHERPALFHVAGIARVIDVVAHQHCRSNGAVWIVAVGAAHHAFANGMARRPANLRPLLFVTGEAHVRLGELVTHRVMSGMHLVTGRARNIIALVRAAGPMDARAALVTGRADLVLLRRIHLAESVRHGIAGTLDVLGRVAVAHRASDAHRGTGIGFRSVLACPHELRIGMAVRAEFSVADFVGRLGKCTTRKDQQSAGKQRPLQASRDSPAMKAARESIA